MKSIRFIKLSIVCLMLTISAGAQDSKSDSILVNVQDKIYEAFLASFQDQNILKLTEIQESISKLNSNSQIVNYWIPYSKYYESIYYLKKGDNKNSKITIEQGIDYLYGIKNKNSESYALLAHLQSFSIQFVKGMSVIGISQKVQENAQKALKLNQKNIRAWYVLACNDYYKPKQYGGGKKCEKYLLEAINIDYDTPNNPYLPTWGVSDSYALLVSYYFDNKQMDKGNEVLSKALKLFPNDYMLNQYANQH